MIPSHEQPARPDDTAGRRGWLLCGGAQPSLFQSYCQALSRERVSQAHRDVAWDQYFNTSHTVSQQRVPQHSTHSWDYLAAGPLTWFKLSQNNPQFANLCFNVLSISAFSSISSPELPLCYFWVGKGVWHPEETSHSPDGTWRQEGTPQPGVPAPRAGWGSPGAPQSSPRVGVTRRGTGQPCAVAASQLSSPSRAEGQQGFSLPN